MQLVLQLLMQLMYYAKLYLALVYKVWMAKHGKTRQFFAYPGRVPTRHQHRLHNSSSTTALGKAGIKEQSQRLSDQLNPSINYLID